VRQTPERGSYGVVKKEEGMDTLEKRDTQMRGKIRSLDSHVRTSWRTGRGT